MAKTRGETSSSLPPAQRRGKVLKIPQSTKTYPKTKPKDNNRVENRGKSKDYEEDGYEDEESYDKMERSDTRDIDIDPVDVSDLSRYFNMHLRRRCMLLYD